MQLTQDWLMVLPDKDGEYQKSNGGIFIVTDNKDLHTEWAEVRQVGPGVVEYGKKKPMRIKEGNRVLYKTKQAMEMQVHGKNFVIVRERDVIAYE